MRLKRIAVLVSGGGTNLQMLIDAVQAGLIQAEIALVLSSKPEVYALERAKKAGIPTETVARTLYKDDLDRYGETVKQVIDRYDIDYIVLAGYLSILSPALVKDYPHRIVNVHPALIPSFCGKGYYGSRVHQAVLDAGVKVSGVTVHFADEGTDTGPIIAQRCVPVLFEDDVQSLSARTLEMEHALLVESVKALVEGRLIVHRNRVQWLTSSCV